MPIGLVFCSVQVEAAVPRQFWNCAFCRIGEGARQVAAREEVARENDDVLIDVVDRTRFAGVSTQAMLAAQLRERFLIPGRTGEESAVCQADVRAMRKRARSAARCRAF